MVVQQIHSTKRITTERTKLDDIQDENCCKNEDGTDENGARLSRELSVQ